MVLLSYPLRTYAQDCNLHCLGEQIQQLENQRKLSEAATAPLEGEVSKIEAQLASITTQISRAKAEIESLRVSVAERESKLAADITLLNNRIRSLYKRSRSYSPLTILLQSDSASHTTRNLTYQATLADKDRSSITQTTTEILALESDRQRLESDSVELAGLSARLDAQQSFFESEIKKAKDFQNKLSNQIADLTKRQQEILTAKTDTFQTTVGDVPAADDPASRPDFNPGFSPAFAGFSFGAPHFKGMSQYGAYGRAKSGQDAETILRAYYGDGIEIKKDYPTDTQIRVDGYGSYSLEDYVRRIYEVPNSWGSNGGMEALKAQAVAARSYALARTNAGASSICATEACQVFKPDAKGGAWEEAVNATRGWVLMAGGKPFSAWYSSTSGGYLMSYSHNGHSTPGFWDTKNGRDGWTSEAYEKIGGSPWFYKGWYKTRAGDSCGRSHPWLNGEEMADILNAWVVLVKHGQGDDRVTPLGGCWGGNPYSIGELRDRANTLSTGYSKVTSVSVTYANNGVTANVNLNTDKGSLTISGSDFKKAFNLRAPGNIAIKSNLYNIESK